MKKGFLTFLPALVVAAPLQLALAQTSPAPAPRAAAADSSQLLENARALGEQAKAIARAKTDAERDQLIAEHMRTLRQGMRLSAGMLGGRAGAGPMGPGTMGNRIGGMAPGMMGGMGCPMGRMGPGMHGYGMPGMQDGEHTAMERRMGELEQRIAAMEQALQRGGGR